MGASSRGSGVPAASSPPHIRDTNEELAPMGRSYRSIVMTDRA